LFVMCSLTFESTLSIIIQALDHHFNIWINIKYYHSSIRSSLHEQCNFLH